MTGGGKVAGVSKIAVVRANALGDFIFVLPALRALRATYPAAEIVFLGKPWLQDFAPGRVDAIDRVVAVPPCEGVGAEPGTPTDEAALEAFFARMRRERFDIALQLHGGGRYSNPFVSRLGARLTVGLQAQGARPLDRTLPYVYYQNELLCYLEVVSLIGARTDRLAPRVSVTAQDRAEAAASASPLYIMIHPGASDPRRRWPADRFGAVARHFLEAGFAVCVTGLEAEAALADRVVRFTDNRAVSLAGKLSLGGLAAFSADAALVLSNDTGPLHLATAVGAKTVGIYWCGNLIISGPVTRAGHRPLISWMQKCNDCASHHPSVGEECRHRVSFVTEVTIEQCLAACEDLLRWKP